MSRRPRGKAKKCPAKATRRARVQKGATEARTNNKKAEVVARMKRAKGAGLAEIMAATSWQRHTIRGFVSLLGSKGGLKIESTKNAAGERSCRIAKYPARANKPFPPNAAPGSSLGGVAVMCG
ncbi:MAG TPA: DUF3489 domain-containing protein [Bryobacteraceae bacterium]|nr:DUF3489 domain-containing protein [Bryobacteraceae bacterium]